MVKTKKTTNKNVCPFCGGYLPSGEGSDCAPYVHGTVDAKSGRFQQEGKGECYKQGYEDGMYELDSQEHSKEED